MGLIFFSRTDPFEVAFLRLPKLSLQFLGFWPTDTVTRLTVIKIFINLIALLIAVLSEIRFTWLIRREPIEAFAAICPSLTELVVLIKLVFYLIYRKEFTKLLTELYDHLCVDIKDPRKKSIVRDVSFSNAVWFVFIYFFATATLVSYALKPLIVWAYQRCTEVHDTWVSLPFRAALPYEDMTQLNDKSLYTFVYLLLVYSGIVTIIGFTAVDSAFISFCMYISVSFRLLQDDFTQVLKTFDSSESNLMYEKLSKLVRRQQNIIKIFNRFEKVYKYMIFGHFLSAGIGLGLALVNLLLAPGMSKAIYVNFVLGVSCELYAYCYGSEKVDESCLQLSEALYFTEWYKCDVKTQKLVLLVMAKSQRGSLFHVPFFSPSLSLFASIVKKSGSYLTIMMEFI